MLSLDLSPESLGGTRFGYSPLSELAHSVRALQTPTLPRLLQPWARETLSQLDAADFELLAAAIPAPPMHYAPVFMFAPALSAMTFESQLEQLRARPDEDLALDIERAWRGELPAAAGHALRVPDLAERLAALFWRYWQVAVAPYWDRMVTVIDQDIELRSSGIARRGLVSVMNEIHPTLRVHGAQLRVDKPYLQQRVANGRPMLIPAIFVWPRLAIIHDSSGRFDIMYGADGIGRVWQGLGSSPAEPLTDLIGRGRATLLLRLDVAKTTSELAAELGASPGGVSQHLSILRRAKMVTRRRKGRDVYYYRTYLADELIDQTSSSPPGPPDLVI